MAITKTQLQEILKVYKNKLNIFERESSRGGYDLFLSEIKLSFFLLNDKILALLIKQVFLDGKISVPVMQRIINNYLIHHMYSDEIRGGAVSLENLKNFLTEELEAQFHFLKSFQDSEMLPMESNVYQKFMLGSEGAIDAYDKLRERHQNMYFQTKNLTYIPFREFEKIYTEIKYVSTDNQLIKKLQKVAVESRPSEENVGLKPFIKNDKNGATLGFRGRKAQKVFKNRTSDQYRLAIYARDNKDYYPISHVYDCVVHSKNRDTKITSSKKMEKLLQVRRDLMRKLDLGDIEFVIRRHNQDQDKIQVFFDRAGNSGK